MINTIITLIGYLATFFIFGLILFKINQFVEFHFHIKRCRGMRFVTVPAYLTFKQNTRDNEIEFSDPELNRLMSKEDTQEYKYVNISYVLDLEMVKSYHEYTYDDGGMSTVRLDCTYITFNEGSYIVINLPFFDFDNIMNNYNNVMYNLS